MEYSKITAWEVINFMSFEKARAEFDETGIVNFKGFNDSGKSAMLRALSVCLMDKYKSKQAKFIRDGSEYLRIVVYFDDGVSILRDKYINGQSLYEVYKGDTCIFTTKQGNKLTRIDGVPQKIADYLGLCVTDSVYLNYQTNEEKLPFVDTTGSENYQAFHEVLRMEEIYRASNMINVDKNELGSAITEIESELQRDEVLLEKCGDVTQELISELEVLDKESNITNDKNTKLNEINEYLTKVISFKEVPSIPKVSSDRLSNLIAISDIADKLASIKEVPKLTKVNEDRLKNIYELLNAVTHLEGLEDVPMIPKVDTTWVSKNNDLLKVYEIYSKFIAVLNECSDVNSKLAGAKESLNTLLESAKEQGIELVKCVNCGSYTTVGGHTHE